jgi:hypothetical protein
MGKAVSNTTVLPLVPLRATRGNPPTSTMLAARRNGRSENIFGFYFSNKLYFNISLPSFFHIKKGVGQLGDLWVVC